MRRSRRLAPIALAALCAATAAPNASAQHFVRDVIGPQADDRYGQVVAVLSDVDGDGGADYAVGAPLHDEKTFLWTHADAGRVWICNGRTGALIRSHTGPSSNERFGSAITVMPDCDGDGKRDYAIGAPGRAGDAGRATVFSAANGAEIWHFDSSVAGRQMGAALALVGDANGDGKEDLAIGCPEPGIGSGYVYVRDHANVGLFNLYGPQFDCRFGSAISRAPDLNGDGKFDLLVGAPLYDAFLLGQTVVDCGQGLSFSGANGASLGTFNTYAVGGRLGSSIALLLDTNADGFNDFAFGAPTWSNATGYVQVYDGKTKLPLQRIDSSYTNNEWFGQAICNAGDWNGDGRGDLAIGIPGYSGNGCGGIEIRSGTNGALLWTVDALFRPYGSGEVNRAYGSALASGFLDADWAFDLVIGDPWFEKSGAARGSHHVIERF